MYKAARNRRVVRYLDGQKRYGICEMYIHWDGLHCPCCGSRLRSKPHLPGQSAGTAKCAHPRQNINNTGKIINFATCDNNRRVLSFPPPAARARHGRRTIRMSAATMRKEESGRPPDRPAAMLHRMFDECLLGQLGYRLGIAVALQLVEPVVAYLPRRRRYSPTYRYLVTCRTNNGVIVPYRPTSPSVQK